MDENGKVKMVDVSTKVSTERMAIAEARVRLGEDVIAMIVQGNMKKGDVITTAKIAGIMAAKKTSSLIPLCHQLNLSSVSITISFDKEHAIISSTVKTTERTGVEMEALTATSIASLTLYDMVKSVKKDVIIENIKLISKTGGKSDWHL